MSVPQAACLAIAVLLIEFPVSNGFTLMRNTGCNQEGEKNACHPHADERSAGEEEERRIGYITALAVTISTSKFCRAFLILSRDFCAAQYRCNLNRGAINLVTRYIYLKRSLIFIRYRNFASSFVNEFPLFQLPDYSQLIATVTIVLRKFLSLFILGDNLFEIRIDLSNV